MSVLPGNREGFGGTDMKILSQRQGRSAPAIGECDVCQRPVRLEYFTNSCECGADYNTFGQRLAPREQWGHETGEHWTDLLHLDGEGDE